MTIRGAPSPRLGVEVEVELPGVRAQADGVDLVFALVGEPCLDDVVGEDVATAKEFVVGLEGAQGLVEGAGDSLQAALFARRKLVRVLLERAPGSIFFWTPSRPAISIAEKAR